VDNPRDVTNPDQRIALAEAVARATPDCIYVYDFDAGEYVYSNRSIPEYLGYSEEFVAGMSDAEFHAMVGHPDEAEQAQVVLRRQRTMGEGDALEHTFRMRTGSGEFRWHSVRIVPFELDENGRAFQFLSVLRDVHDVIESNLRLTTSERRFRELFDRSPVGIAIVDDDGRFLEVNDSLCTFLGLTRDRIMETTYDAVVHPAERIAAREGRSRFVREGISTTNTERRFVHSDGSTRWARLSTTRVVDAGRPVNLASFQDVTAIKGVEERLRHAALHDSLTGLPNRRLLEDRLDKALARRARGRHEVAVLFLDLDHVKAVNDTLGHDYGDDLLVEMSRRLERSVRSADTVARIGGDEFIVVCEDVSNITELNQLADRILEAVAEPLRLSDEIVSITASVGIALPGPRGATPEELLREADLAMYEAKVSGRARWVIHHAVGQSRVGVQRTGE
jgi:diguanylate cyclase (GGDEF)-like protein/PAS domain S-box-containing protein